MQEESQAPSCQKQCPKKIVSTQCMEQLNFCNRCKKRCYKHESVQAALREVLATIENQKCSIVKTIETNINKVVMPLLHGIEGLLPGSERGKVQLLKQRLQDITDPYVDRLSNQIPGLTPSEIRICELVKNGMSSKEIASTLHLSPATVSRHREHIRRKLGLVRNGANLASYLQMQMKKDRNNAKVHVLPDQVDQAA